MQGARPGRHGACEIRWAMGLKMPLIDYAPILPNKFLLSDAPRPRSHAE
jgi:hypothetical protein